MPWRPTPSTNHMVFEAAFGDESLCGRTRWSTWPKANGISKSTLDNPKMLKDCTHSSSSSVAPSCVRCLESPEPGTSENVKTSHVQQFGYRSDMTTNMDAIVLAARVMRMIDKARVAQGKLSRTHVHKKATTSILDSL